MITKNEAHNRFKKIIHQISTAIDSGESKHIFSEAATGKTTAMMETIKRYNDRYFVVFLPTKAVTDIYRRELRDYKNYKLIDSRMSQKADSMCGLNNYVVFFDGVDMMLSARHITRDELEDIELIARAGRASVITTSRS